MRFQVTWFIDIVPRTFMSQNFEFSPLGNEDVNIRYT